MQPPVPAGLRGFTSNEVRARAIILGALFLAALLPMGILAVRVNRFDALTFGFLGWNLFLAGVPVALASLAELSWRFRKRVMTVGLLIGWLAFFPNAPYITTDLIHLRERPPVPVWFDALILTSAALAGLLAGFVSLYLVHQMAEARFGVRWGWALCAIVCPRRPSGYISAGSPDSTAGISSPPPARSSTTSVTASSIRCRDRPLWP